MKRRAVGAVKDEEAAWRREIAAVDAVKDEEAAWRRERAVDAVEDHEAAWRRERAAIEEEGEVPPEVPSVSKQEGGEESHAAPGVYVHADTVHNASPMEMPLAGPKKMPNQKEAAPPGLLIPTPPEPPERPFSPPPLPPPRPRHFRRMPCKFWAWGRCSKGEQCQFLHEPGREFSNSEDHCSKVPCRYHFSSKGCINGDLGPMFFGILIRVNEIPNPISPPPIMLYHLVARVCIA